MSEPTRTPESAMTDTYAHRLRLLVDAGIFVSRELHLDDVLDRIVQTAATVIGSRYAALGVIDEAGSGLSKFVFTGLSAFDKEHIGKLPVGRGLLGALIADPQPICLPDLSKDPRSVGFPPNHPPMKTFLGVPVHARGKVFGNLYLTEKNGGEHFTDEDERLAVVLAGQAGVAIENARLYEEAERNEAAARRRQHALELVHEVGSAVVGELDASRILRLVAQRARTLVGADGASISLRDELSDELVIRVAAGPRAGAVEGVRYPREGSLTGMVLESLEPVMVDDSASDPRVNLPLAQVAEARSAVCAPLIESGEAIGVLSAYSSEMSRFDAEDLFVIKSFADLASIALQNAKGVEVLRERAQLEAELAESQLRETMRTQTLQAVIRAQEEERSRIARELHDSFGQQMTGILLGLKVIEEEGSLDEVRSIVARLRDLTAAAAADVRRIAFELRPSVLDDLGLGPALERYADDVKQRTKIGMRVDLVLGARLPADVETVVYRITQEAVTNAAKYAVPDSIAISVSSTDGDVRLTVADDGRGFDLEEAQTRGLGLLGMQERAELVGGKLAIRTAPGEGSTVELYVPGPQTLDS